MRRRRRRRRRQAGLGRLGEVSAVGLCEYISAGLNARETDRSVSRKAMPDWGNMASR